MRSSYRLLQTINVPLIFDGSTRTRCRLSTIVQQSKSWTDNATNADIVWSGRSETKTLKRDSRRKRVPVNSGRWILAAAPKNLFDFIGTGSQRFAAYLPINKVKDKEQTAQTGRQTHASREIVWERNCTKANVVLLPTCSSFAGHSLDSSKNKNKINVL